MSLSPERAAEIGAEQKRLNLEQARKSGKEHRDWNTVTGHKMAPARDTRSAPRAAAVRSRRSRPAE